MEARFVIVLKPVDAVAKSSADAVTVSTPIAAITFDGNAIKAIAGQQLPMLG